MRETLKLIECDDHAWREARECGELSVKNLGVVDLDASPSRPSLNDSKVDGAGGGDGSGQADRGMARRGWCGGMSG